MQRALFSLVVVGVFSSACGADRDAAGPSAPDADGGVPDGGGGAPDPEAYRAATDHLFDSSRRFELGLELPPADWRSLGEEGRGLSVAGCDFTGQAAEFSYTQFGAEAVIEGEAIADVAVRKKGFIGSLSITRPSLKLSFDDLVPGREWSGLEHMTLNNNRQDASMIRQCVAYSIFRRAGVPAPRCGFADVVVNGDELGTYTHVEGIGRRMLGLHFADTTGNLYEGQGADFLAARWNGFQLKTNQATADRSDLTAMADALAASDADLLAALEPILDVEDFFTYWAMESLVGHWDTYSTTRNNYFLYDDPDTGFHFIPWGADATLSEDGLIPGSARPQSISADSDLSKRLFSLEETRGRYIARVRELLASIWDEEAILADVDAMEAALPDADAAEVEGIREFIRRRRDVVTAELDAGPVPVTTGDICFAPGELTSGTFRTVWVEPGSTAPLPTDSTATLDLTIDGKPVILSALTAIGGPVAIGGPPGAGVRLSGTPPDGSLFLLQLSVETRLFGVGDVPFHAVADAGIVLGVIPPSTTPDLVGFISDGTLHFSSASRVDGAPLEGSFSGRFYRARH